MVAVGAVQPDGVRLWFRSEHTGKHRLGPNRNPLPASFHYRFDYGRLAGFVMDLRSGRKAGNTRNTIYSSAQFSELRKCLVSSREKHVLVIVVSVSVVHIPSWLATAGATMAECRFSGPMVLRQEPRCSKSLAQTLAQASRGKARAANYSGGWRHAHRCRIRNPLEGRQQANDVSVHFERDVQSTQRPFVLALQRRAKVGEGIEHRNGLSQGEAPYERGCCGESLWRAQRWGGASAQSGWAFHRAI